MEIYVTLNHTDIKTYKYNCVAAYSFVIVFFVELIIFFGVKR